MARANKTNGNSSQSCAAVGFKAQACQSTIGQIVDGAMAGIERDTPALKGVLPKDHARPTLVKQRRSQLINLISNIEVGDEATRTIRGIDAQIAYGDTFHNDRFLDLKADFILANPPFNVSDWGGERLQGYKRWQFGAPPAGARS